MNRKIAFLRGINVGGKRKILMTDLISLCGNLGWENVVTYIQSGNIIFDSDAPNSELEKNLEIAIAEKYGFDIPVIIRSSNELQTAIDRNPFYDEDSKIDQLHLTFLKENPTKENVEKTRTCNYEPDKFKIEDKEVFVYCTGKYHRSKLTNTFFGKKLNTATTTRNWKTVLKLSELIKN